MSKKIVYVAGPISSDPDYKTKFDAVAKEIEDMGYAVYNPTWQPLGLEYKQYIDVSLKMLMECDAVVFLEGWMDSDGAVLENVYCGTVGIPKIYADAWGWKISLKEILQ